MDERKVFSALSSKYTTKPTSSPLLHQHLRHSLSKYLPSTQPTPGYDQGVWTLQSKMEKFLP
jgi:hypothetical protein